MNLIRPSEDSFREFFESFYAQCKISPADVSYLEADGSGCKVFTYDCLKYNQLIILKMSSHLVLRRKRTQCIIRNFLQ